MRKLLIALFALAIALPVLAQKPMAEKITQPPRVEGVGDTWAVIAWTTDTGGSSVVHYGTDRNSLTQMGESPYSRANGGAGANHRVRLEHLKPGTTYYFQVMSGQGQGTGTQDMGSVGQFTTKGAGQSSGGSPKSEAEKIIDGPRVEGVGNTWAVVAWTTNTGGSSIVHFGTDRNSLAQTAQAPYADNDNPGTKYQTHRVRLQNLKPNTTYYFVADSGQGEGTGSEAKSSVQQFTTKPQ